MRVVPSSVPDVTLRPSGEKASDLTSSLCASKGSPIIFVWNRQKGTKHETRSIWWEGNWPNPAVIPKPWSPSLLTSSVIPQSDGFIDWTRCSSRTVGREYYWCNPAVVATQKLPNLLSSCCIPDFDDPLDAVGHDPTTVRGVYSRINRRALLQWFPNLFSLSWHPRSVR